LVMTSIDHTERAFGFCCRQQVAATQCGHLLCAVPNARFRGNWLTHGGLRWSIFGRQRLRMPRSWHKLRLRAI
jgi:hypothetical protein